MKNIGILTSFTSEIFRSEYYSRILSGIISALQPTSHKTKFVMVRESEIALAQQEILDKYSLEGLLVLTWRIHAQIVSEIRAYNPSFPMVLINDISPSLKENIVYTDAVEGTCIAMHHLFQRGCKKIGMIQGPTQDSLDAQVRERVFREILKKEGVTLEPHHFLQCDYFFEEDSYIRVLELIHSGKTLPRAFICFNDDLAVGAIRALREEKYLVPQEVAVIGFDGTERGKFIIPPLTTVLQPLEQMGREMVRIVLGLMEGRLEAPVQMRFESQLVIRQSA